MSKKDQPSKYLSSFYSTPSGQSAQKNVPNSSILPKPSANEADKFKNPADFFKSSQSIASQTPLSQFRSFQTVKRTSFGGGGSSHEMLSQVFQPKKRVLEQIGKPLSVKPNFANSNMPFAPPQKKPFVGLDENLASTKALELQWTTKMRQAKKTGVEAQKLQGVNSSEKMNLTRSDTGKSPMGKSSWADKSFTKTVNACKNQQNDPWYSNDVWGDDLPFEAVDECLRVASTQEIKKSSENVITDDPLSSWVDEPWASPEKGALLTRYQVKTGTSVKTSLFPGNEKGSKEKTDDFMSLLSEDDGSFMAFLENVESQQKPSSPYSAFTKRKTPSFSIETNVPSTSQVRSFQSQLCAPSSQAKLPSAPLLNIACRKNIPFSDRMPLTSATGPSFIIKAKEYESPNKYETLSISQRKLQKPTKSLPSPVSTKHGFTTEWLRGQLEKISSEYSTLKENVQVKEGESKLLREKLKTAEEEVQKHKLEKVKELETLREAFEKKVKQLEKQLEATQVQAMFKAKEAESSLEKYRELKTVSVHTPERPLLSQSFKNLPSFGSRPGEVLFVNETVSISEDVIDETMEVLMSPTRNTLEPLIEATPEKGTLEGSPVNDVIEETPKVKKSESNDNHVDKHHIFQECQIAEKIMMFPPKRKLFTGDFFRRNAVLFQVVDKVVHGDQPKKELNHFLMPRTEYLPHMLLQTEFSEQEFENYYVRRPTLVEMWGTTYDAFGDAVLNDYEKAKVGDSLPKDPAKDILSKGRYFSTLESVHACLITLSNKIKWGDQDRAIAQRVVDLATDMVRELYATLGDPRLLQTAYTIYDRDPEILRDFQDCSELIEKVDPLSHKKWKNECYVELRRCLVIVGYLCTADHMTARHIVNPKAFKSGRTSEFYPPNSESSSTGSKNADDSREITLKVTIDEGIRKPSELKLMQMYRDLYNKKLTVVSEMALAFKPKNDRQVTLPDEMCFDSDRLNETWIINGKKLSIQSALDQALVRSEQGNSRTNVILRSQYPCQNKEFPSYEEYINYLKTFDMKSKGNDLKELVDKIQGDLNPKKMYHLKMMSEQSKAVGESNLNKETSDSPVDDWVKIPSKLVEALNSDILQINLGSNCSVYSAPVNKCITDLEKQLVNLALNNIKDLKTRAQKSVGSGASSDLDVTRYVPNSPDTDCEFSRKRKISIEEVEPRKTMKVAEYQTPPFDKTLYSQIQMRDMEENSVVILESQTQSLSAENDQLAKFEKREEIAELKKKMLAEEQKSEHKYSKPSISGRSLAPVKLPGKTATWDHSADDEMVVEIEKMFQSQAKPEVFEESVLSSESDDETSERFRTLSTGSEEALEIEFIPDLVKKFHLKLKNAGLLELLCEVFKDGGVLRFTHRLNGVMLGTVLMLQQLVSYQRREAEPYCSKIATVIREILYTRPSPRIVLEVNVLLRYAVSIPGFSKMLCHNASPETFVIRPDRVCFTRGACLLEVICILVTYATDEDSPHEMYSEMSHWVFIVCSQKILTQHLFEQFYNNKRRCMCILALNNTMVMIYHRALTQYRGLRETNSMNTHKIKTLEKIFRCGLQVLLIMYSYNPSAFLSTLTTQYQEYYQLLTGLKDMHECTLFHKDFRLRDDELLIVVELLSNSKDPNPIPERPSQVKVPSDFGKFFGKGKSWPYDINNTSSLIKSDSSESDDD